MKLFIPILVAGALFGLPVAAEDVNFMSGGDSYVAGQRAVISAPVAHDAFVGGYDVSLAAAVAGDAHLVGFNVSAASDVAGDLYAAGFSVNITGKVGSDVTALGNSVNLSASEAIKGNVRLSGQSVILGSPVEGAAIITAQTLSLDAAVAGDLTFLGEAISFGPAARVAGMVNIRAPQPIVVPESVAPAERVIFQQVASPDYMSEAGRTAETVVKGFWPAFWTMVIWWAVLLLIGAAFIALMPRGVAAMQIVAEKRPFRNLGLGILAFASVVGLVPVFALTVIGIVLLPFVFVFVFVACSLAYLGGVYFAGVQIARAFVPVASNVQKLAVLAVAIVAAALIGMIPFAGWLISLAFVAFGFGVMAMVLMVRWSRKDAVRLAPPLQGGDAAVASPGAI